MLEGHVISTSAYEGHAPCGSSRLHSCIYELKNMCTMMHSILPLTHTTLTPAQSQEYIKDQIILLIMDGVHYISTSIIALHSSCSFVLPPILPSPMRRLPSFIQLLASFNYLDTSLSQIPLITYYSAPSPTQTSSSTCFRTTSWTTFVALVSHPLVVSISFSLLLKLSLNETLTSCVLARIF